MSHYLRILNATLRIEGVYSNDRDDPGGETYCAVARKRHPTWSGWVIIDRHKEERDGFEFIEALALDPDLRWEVEEFYRREFWNKIAGDRVAAISPLVAEELFDTAVNVHPTRAVKFLQRALSLLNKEEKLYSDLIVDGVVGPMTLLALWTFKNKYGCEDLLVLMNILQGMRYVTLAERNPKLEKYMRGWIRTRVLLRNKEVKE